ncbi:calcineurin-like phosphoesterase [Nitzschia inconspicua]|uniref:Calcineurin-like phosphoesterase n=1 Tax=Nitzschia inconspicua TaxID=303405 RepID=A0A9K3KTR9_9STRA|nr:calcineurin-like phosphoesterase [Nitzschia inconspicua]
MPFVRSFFHSYQRRYFFQGIPPIRTLECRLKTTRYIGSVPLVRGGAFRDSAERPLFHQTRDVASTNLRAVSVDSTEFQNFLAEHDNIQLSYITDIEGDKAYLDRYVQTSKVLTFTKRTPTSTISIFQRRTIDSEDNNLPYIFPYDHCIDFLDSNSMLVFGGDLWDKGGFDLYVSRQLLDLKRRYPHRVFWVLGNRDINKLRMMQELGVPDPNFTKPVRVPYHPGLTWFRGSGRVGDPKGELPSMDPGERLKWILGHTMGSPDAMEHRRQELAWEASFFSNTPLSEIKISDDEVVRSYQESCHPRGEMGLFLWHALLAARVGPVLFVHGSLPLTTEVMENAKNESRSLWDDLTFALPWLEKTKEGNDHQVTISIEQWMDALNQFCHDNLERWRHDIAKLEKSRHELEEKGIDYYDVQTKQSAKKSIWAYRGGYGNGPPYSDLIQYGMGMTSDGKKNPTVVYNSFTPEGMPNSFLPAEKREEKTESDVAKCTREFFARSSIQLILTGHKPQGDSPSPIRVDDSSWVICADTSYSGDTLWWDGMNDERNEMGLNPTSRSNLGRGNSLSFRGDVAVSEVLISLSKNGTSLDSVKYHGKLSDGTDYESLNLLEAASLQTTLGQVAPEHMVPDTLDSPHQGRWWTKNIFSDGSQLFHAGEGFNVWNYVVMQKEVETVSPTK